MSTIPTLTTARLLLRPFALADAPVVARLAGDHAVADTTDNIPHPYEEPMAVDWIAGHQSLFDRGAGVVFAITCHGEPAPIGAIGLGDIRQGHQANLGYWIGTPFWRRGYCTEAAQAVLGYAFTTLGLRRVHSSHLSRNPASGRVLRKVGMHHEGCRRGHVLKWGRPEDLEVFGLLREEWLALDTAATRADRGR